MSRSRYSDTPVIDGKFYSTFTLPRNPGGIKNVDLLLGVKTIEYVFKRGDRLDHISARFLGDDDYWWLIALVNGINYPFASGGLIPGKVLNIPVQAQDVLDKLMR